MSGNFEAHIPALAAAKLDSFFRWSRRRDLRRLPDLLAPGEAVVHLGQGGRSPWWYGTSYWLVVLTNRRVLLLRTTLRRSLIYEYPLSKIHAIEARNESSGGRVTLHIPGRKVVVDSIYPKSEAAAIAEYVREHIQPPRPGVEPVQLIAKLAELQEVGILTVEEFEAKKADLMERIRARMEDIPEAFKPVEQIKRIAELRDAGIVTQEEFAARKTDLLAGI